MGVGVLGIGYWVLGIGYWDLDVGMESITCRKRGVGGLVGGFVSR